MKIAITLSLCTIVCTEIAFCQSTTPDSLYLQEKPELLNTVVVFDTDNKNATSQNIPYSCAPVKIALLIFFDAFVGGK